MAVSVHYQVDQLLLEQGEYLPLEFLLQEGRLSYPEYEAWRNGELELLDQALFGDPDQVRQQLAAAEHYLQSRGWRAETVRYEAWHDPHARNSSGSTPRPLRFSADPALDACFHRRYQKPQDRPQLDLFTDSPATTLANGIARSVADRRPAEARRQLQRLLQIAPDHARLGELERLTEAAEALDTPVGELGIELRRLQNSLTPLAEVLLGPGSRNLLIPLWRRLSQALQDEPYRAAEPELHLSYTAAQALDWAGVRLAVEREPSWQSDALLLLRHAQACDQQRDYAAALPSWFALCWRFAEQADAIQASHNSELRLQWLAFHDLDPALPVGTFPAWLLLRRPGLARSLPEPSANPGAYPESYQTVYRLQRARASPAVGSRADDMALRIRLKEQDPALFGQFLSAVR